MSLMDYLDDYLLGPMNLLDVLEGVLHGIRYGDFGYQFIIPRADKDGAFTLNEARTLLKEYGVDTFWFGFDATNMYFRVKKRQARWAEYILLHAGVELRNPTFDQRNPGYVAKHSPGWMPTPWSERTVEAADGDDLSEEREEVKGIAGWLDRLLGI